MQAGNSISGFVSLALIRLIPKNETGILASYFFDVYICRDSKLTWLLFPFSLFTQTKNVFLLTSHTIPVSPGANFYLCRLHNANGFAFSTAIK